MESLPMRPMARLYALRLMVLVPLSLLPAGGALAAPGEFDVRDHGAKGDGKTIDTDAINRTVAACGEAGGGVVRLPAGRYLSGTVRLRSGATLRLDAGAAIVGTPDLTAYEGFVPPAGAIEARWRNWHRALVLGVDVHDVAIVGEGMIDGNNVRDRHGEEGVRGPHAVLLGHSRGIAIRGVTVRDAANYAVMLEECSDVQVVGASFVGGWDGVHFRGWSEDEPCRDVSIVDCRFATGDDAIAGRYWRDVLIRGCEVNSSCNGIRLIGPAHGLIVHDCLFFGPGRRPHITSGRTKMLSGINLQPGAWDPTRGRLDDVLISDVTMRNVQTPVYLSVRDGNTCGTVTVERLSATGVYEAAISAEGWADRPIDRLVLRDVSAEFAGGGTKEQADRRVERPGIEARPLPAWGLFARNVGELALDGVRLRLATPDARPAIRAEHVGRMRVEDLRHDPRAGGGEAILVEDVGERVGGPSRP
ncbi:Exo-poly-alpha-D-galacturonosidase precursor [Aquisphaera giovannonii]|uniref:Exo-poly-alpha-D-galacturonosidase n=1 Tax=Aquisphaera giovannonii TaxID=406548 RepID=A0A5B9W3D4_9BACT|nr:glycosyl hydrolase family 28-related protein [Aquisphaera giovannonii]QEH34759.1 Exo-poly-alpha-D-galacturonosidase precursor [Aquisphaera giovannonii]